MKMIPNLTWAGGIRSMMIGITLSETRATPQKGSIIKKGQFFKRVNYCITLYAFIFYWNRLFLFKFLTESWSCAWWYSIWCKHQGGQAYIHSWSSLSFQPKAQHVISHYLKMYPYGLFTGQYNLLMVILNPLFYWFVQTEHLKARKSGNGTKTLE